MNIHAGASEDTGTRGWTWGASGQIGEPDDPGSGFSFVNAFRLLHFFVKDATNGR